MTETANLYANLYNHVLSSRINCLDEVLHEETVGKKKCLREENKVSKMKDYAWFERLIEFAAAIAGNIKWTGVNEHELCDGDMKALRGMDTKQLHPFSAVGQYIYTPDFVNYNCFLGQGNQENNNLANRPSPVINQRNVGERDDMTSMRSVLKSNKCLFDGVGVDDNITVTDTEDESNNMGTNFISSKIPTSTSMSSSVSSVTMVNNSPSTQRNNELNENSRLKNYIIDKDVKITELLMQLKLAQHTINQQQCVIRDLEKKLGNIVGNVGSGPIKEESNTSTEKSQLELRDAIKLLHAQNDQLKYNESLIDELNASKVMLTIELEDGKEKRNKLEDSIDVLRGVIYQLQVNNFLFESQIGMVSDTDVLILHDTFLKHIKTDLFQKQQLIMENILCHHLSDALLNLQTYREKAEVVIVHTGTNDLASLQVEEMCSIVRDIHACVTNNGMKLIICNITPNYEQSELTRKVHLFNSNISHRLGAYDNVTVCKSDDLNFREILLQEYVNGRTRDCTRDKQINNRNKLPRNKRFSPYQSGGKENNNVHRLTVKDTFQKQPRTV